MNIVLYVNSFLPTVGGKEIVVHYLARELKRLGNRVRVVGPSGWIKKRHHHYDYPVHRWPTLRKFFPEAVAYSQLFLDTAIFGCDVVHAHTTYPNGYLTSLLKKTRNLPLVITPHGYDIHVIPEIGFGQRLNPERCKKIEFAIKRAELVTAISESVESSLIDAGCNTAKIRKIPNGIDIERFQADHYPSVRKWLGFDENTKIILSVGNYHQRKGQRYIIEAMPQILSEIPNARLVIVGGNQDPLAEITKALGLDEFVRLTGSIPFPLSGTKSVDAQNGDAFDRIAALYTQSNVYVSASINKEAEGLSLAILDAMGAGLPVVATRISGSIDIVMDGKNGLLVSPADKRELSEAIINVLGHETRSQEMGKQGKRKARHYHWREIAKQYLNVYQEAIYKKA